MTLLHKLLGLLVLLASAAGTGYYYGHGNREISIEKQIVYKEGKERIVTRNHIVTVTRTIQPDGTTKETTTTDDSEIDKEVTEEEIDTIVRNNTKVVQSKYSLGVEFLASSKQTETLTKPDMGITAGLRVIGPAWLSAGFYPTSKQITLGLRMDL